MVRPGVPYSQLSVLEPFLLLSNFQRPCGRKSWHDFYWLYTPHE